MRNEHPIQVWVCMSPGHDSALVFPNDAGLRLHLIREHSKEVSSVPSSEDELDALVSQCISTVPRSPILSVCPVCGDSFADEDVTEKQDILAINHVAEHLHEFARLSFNVDIDESENSEAESAESSASAPDIAAQLPTVKMISEREEFSHRPITPKQIRLFLLSPGSKSDDIVEGSISAESMTDPQAYTALSYTWWGLEDDWEKIPILVDGYKYYITKNLDHALRALRLVNKPQPLWIDQICIDQNNQIERSHQVEFISSIFGNAARVIGYLGPTTNPDVAREAMGLISHIYSRLPHKSDQLFRQILLEESDRSWNALSVMTSLPWVSRS